MAIYADGVGYNLGNSPKPNWGGIADVMLIHQELDFGKINAERLSRGMTAFTTADSIAALRLEEGMYVQAAGFQVALEDTGTGTITCSLGVAGPDTDKDGSGVDTDSDNDLDLFVTGLANNIKSKGYKSAPTYTVDDDTPDAPALRTSRSYMCIANDTNIVLDFVTGVPTNAVIRVWALVARVADKFDEVYQIDYNNRKYDPRVG